MTDLPSPPDAVLRDLDSRRRTEPNGSTWFADDAGYPIFDFDAEGVPYADVRGAALWLFRHRPDLWTIETAPAAQAAPAPVDIRPPAPQTVSEAMLAGRDGRMSFAEVSAFIATVSGSSTKAHHVPASSTPANVSTLMANAKTGDPAAMATLNAKLGLR